jgi:hypothetical protein
MYILVYLITNNTAMFFNLNNIAVHGICIYNSFLKHTITAKSVGVTNKTNIQLSNLIVYYRPLLLLLLLLVTLLFLKILLLDVSFSTTMALLSFEGFSIIVSE